MSRLHAISPAEVSRKLKAYQRPHAVTEKDHWLIQVGQQGVIEGLHHPRHFIKRSFIKSPLSSGQVDQAQLYVAGQAVSPLVKDVGPAARVWETKQSHFCSRVRLRKAEPVRGDGVS